MKRCSRCDQTKPLEAFHRSSRHGHQRWCKECRRSYDARYWQENKHRRSEQWWRKEAFRKWYISLKHGPCADCGRTFPPAAMHWDHRPGEQKLAEVGWLQTRHSKQRILDEIAKCDLVCAVCHAIRTEERRRAA